MKAGRFRQAVVHERAIGHHHAEGLCRDVKQLAVFQLGTDELGGTEYRLAPRHERDHIPFADHRPRFRREDFRAAPDPLDEGSLPWE